MKFIKNALITLLLLTINKSVAEEHSVQAPAPGEKPNIVWIVSEDNSKHYIKLFDENGVPTPAIESLATDGVVFENAFSNTPVCSAARSTLVSGMYGPKLASQYHRAFEDVSMPEGVKMYPAYLREQGYFTSNHFKKDYNIIETPEMWNKAGKKADWKGDEEGRAEGQPFYHFETIYDSHESRIIKFTEEKIAKFDPERMKNAFVQPNHPDTPIFRGSRVHYENKIMDADKLIGRFIGSLKKAGEYENTIIFYFSDHGGVLPGSKGYAYETGLHVPLVVRVPEKWKHLMPYEPGTRTKDFVSFVDITATTLHLAGAEVPEEYDGKVFMGEGIKSEGLGRKNITFGYANRFDEKSDFVRTVRKGKYKYMRSYQPFLMDGLYNNYRYLQPGYGEWRELFATDMLKNDKAKFFFETRRPEQLFDVEVDPYETNDLSQDPAYKGKLEELRQELHAWQDSINDLSFFPEYYITANGKENPVGFGKENADRIKSYRAIADLQFRTYSEAKAELKKALSSSDEFERYWGLVNCLYFKAEALELLGAIKNIFNKETDAYVKATAATYLSIYDGLSDKELHSLVSDITDVNMVINIFDYYTLLNDKYNVNLSNLSLYNNNFKSLSGKDKRKYNLGTRLEHFNRWEEGNYRKNPNQFLGSEGNK